MPMWLPLLPSDGLLLIAVNVCLSVCVCVTGAEHSNRYPLETISFIPIYTKLSPLPHPIFVCLFFFHELFNSHKPKLQKWILFAAINQKYALRNWGYRINILFMIQFNIDSLFILWSSLHIDLRNFSPEFIIHSWKFIICFQGVVWIIFRFFNSFLFISNRR